MPAERPPGGGRLPSVEAAARGPGRQPLARLTAPTAWSWSGRTAPTCRTALMSVGEYAEAARRSMPGLGGAGRRRGRGSRIAWRPPTIRSGRPAVLRPRDHGLAGGAGTYAFLIGFGYFDGRERFETRQFFLADYADERDVLRARRGIRRARCGRPRDVQRPHLRPAAHRDALRDAPDAFALRRAAARGHAPPGTAPVAAAAAVGGDRLWRPTARTGVAAPSRPAARSARSRARSSTVTRIGDVPGAEIPGAVLRLHPPRRRDAARGRLRAQPARPRVARAR